MDKNPDIAIFEQVCEVNELNPDTIRELAKKNSTTGADEATPELLIRTAFKYKAQDLVENLGLGTTSAHDLIQDGHEYHISADPTAPSFTIDEDFIHAKYSEEEARKLIDALGKVMLPVRA